MLFDNLLKTCKLIQNIVYNLIWWLSQLLESVSGMDVGVNPQPPHINKFNSKEFYDINYIMLNIFLAIVSLIFFTTSCQTMRGDKPLAEKVIKSDPSTNLTLGLVQMTVREGASKNDIISSLGSPNMVTSSGSKNETWIYDRVSTDIQRENESGSAGLEVGFGGSGDGEVIGFV